MFSYQTLTNYDYLQNRSLFLPPLYQALISPQKLAVRKKIQYVFMKVNRNYSVLINVDISLLPHRIFLIFIYLFLNYYFSNINIIICIQVGLSLQWFIEDRWSCRGASPLSHLLSTLYPLILFLFVLALATLTR